MTFGLNFNHKEKLFVAVSWIPKGTVQVSGEQHFLRLTCVFNDLLQPPEICVHFCSVS